jgi:phosphoglucomutase
MRPVPMLSFMVRHFKCDAGVCITASHNPAAYNGYKIYWNSGGQLTPPHDKKILDFYTALSDYGLISFQAFNEAKKAGYIVELDKELDSAYLDRVHTLSLFKGKRDLKIVYSPLHGTGVYAVPQALSRFGFQNLTLVPEQSEPDGNFPTVASPNPEDPRALVLAMKLGASLEADLVLATDPDADRLAVVVREDGKWKVFSGNQMGALLFNYVLSLSKSQKRLPSNAFTIKTIVTSDLLKDISTYYGLPCEETLTGFKWICDRVEEYESGKLKPYREFICGAEESYGFLAGTFVRDKDAVLTSVVVSEMLSYYKSLKKNLSEVLDELFLRHGVYHESLETVNLPGKKGDEKIKEIMASLRKNPPASIGNYKIQTIKDYLLRKSKTSNVETEISLPVSDVLQFVCNGALLTVRPSGTEPKIKLYLSLFYPPEKIVQDQLKKIKQELEETSKIIMSSFLSLTVPK